MRKPFQTFYFALNCITMVNFLCGECIVCDTKWNESADTASQRFFRCFFFVMFILKQNSAIKFCENGLRLDIFC